MSERSKSSRDPQFSRKATQNSRQSVSCTICAVTSDVERRRRIRNDKACVARMNRDGDKRDRLRGSVRIITTCQIRMDRRNKGDAEPAIFVPTVVEGIDTT